MKSTLPSRSGPLLARGGITPPPGCEKSNKLGRWGVLPLSSSGTDCAGKWMKKKTAWKGYGYPPAFPLALG